MKVFRSFARLLLRACGAAIAVFAVTLSAPLLDTAVDQHTADLRARPSEPPPRVGITLRRGDTLLSILTRFGLPPQSAYGMIEEIRPVLNPRTLRPGQDVELVFDPYDKSLREVELRLEDSLVKVKATTEGWSAERRALELARETRVVRGTVAGSLYESGIEAGLTPQQVLDLASIFEYDIDFYSDLRAGDSFAVVIEQARRSDGRPVAGRVLAAELNRDGESVRAFYFLSRRGGGYYDETGRALRRPFLRAPLSYVRISSEFSLRRQHPIFRAVRPHRAIDYAAPAGTPVVAIGSGRVEFAGWAAGYGNLVEIRHREGRYASRYGHLSRIETGIREDASVQAGEVVGYVGQTGHATGPHLHFEFLNDGEQIDFLSLKLQGADRLGGAEMESFARTREERLAQLRAPNQDSASAQKRL